MSRVVVLNSVTVDGVMQGPGRPDEDTRGGFEHGGWAIPFADEVSMQAMGAHISAQRGFLFGRRSYEDILGHWNSVPDSPFADALNNAPKYVASTSTEPLRWPNSTQITGDVPKAVAELKQEPGWRPERHGQRRAHPFAPTAWATDRRVHVDDQPHCPGLWPSSVRGRAAEPASTR